MVVNCVFFQLKREKGNNPAKSCHIIMNVIHNLSLLFTPDLHGDLFLQFFFFFRLSRAFII